MATPAAGVGLLAHDTIVVSVVVPAVLEVTSPDVRPVPVRDGVGAGREARVGPTAATPSATTASVSVSAGVWNGGLTHRDGDVRATRRGPCQRRLFGLVGREGPPNLDGRPVGHVLAPAVLREPTRRVPISLGAVRGRGHRPQGAIVAQVVGEGVPRRCRPTLGPRAPRLGHRHDVVDVQPRRPREGPAVVAGDPPARPDRAPAPSASPTPRPTPRLACPDSHGLHRSTW